MWLILAKSKNFLHKKNSTNLNKHLKQQRLVIHMLKLNTPTLQPVHQLLKVCLATKLDAHQRRPGSPIMLLGVFKMCDVILRPEDVQEIA